MYQHRYGFGRVVELSPQVAEERVTESLKTQGFGILTRIDVAATLKQKLGVDQPPYVILGACNPTLAHRALSVEPELGLLLPCNVLVYQDEQGVVRVAAMDPAPVMSMLDNPDITPIAVEVRARLEAALEAV